MMLRKASVALMLLVPTLAWAEPAAKKDVGTTPEALLSEGSLLYWRFDGFEPHRKAIDQTAYAEAMRGDLGHFIDHVWGLAQKTVLSENFGIPDIDDECDAKELCTQLVDYLNHNGVVVGLDLKSVLPLPVGQLTVVFPKAGTPAHRGVVMDVLALAAKLADQDVEEIKLQGRTIHQLTLPLPMHVAWWQEGEHVVFIAGTQPVTQTLALVRTEDDNSTRRLNLTHNPLFQSVNNFDAYETVSRGFIDCDRAAELAVGCLGTQAATMMDQLGLSGLKSVSLYYGFEGRSCRSTVLLKTAGERKGLLRLATACSTAVPSRLPPAPPDATDVSVTSLDLAKVYDTVVDVVKTTAPEQWLELEAQIQEVNELLGVDLREDLLGALGPTIVTYNSPSEGWWLLGCGLAVEVKDSAKLQRALETLVAATGALEDGLRLKKRVYHGVELYTLHGVGEDQQMPVVPTYTIHNGWLVAGLFPQRVQGHILRAQENYPAWRASPLLLDVLAQAGDTPNTKVLSWSESNPEPGIKFLLSLAPALGGYLNMAAPDEFDPVMIPNAHNVAQSLFPNVTLVVDDGKTIRCESYASLSLPIDWMSVAQWYGLACAAGSVTDGFDFGSLSFNWQMPQTPLSLASWTGDAPPPPNAPPLADKQAVPVQPAVPQPAQPPITPLPAQPAPAGGLNFPNLMRMAGNPPVPPMPAQAVPGTPPCPYCQPPYGNAVMPPMTGMPPMPTSMPQMPGTMPQMPGVRFAPTPVANPSTVGLTIKAYPVTDLLAKDGQAAPEAVVIRLVKMVEPNSWQDLGGAGGIDYFPLSNSLIIRQTPDVHEKVEKFLKDLHETVAKQKAR